MRDTGAAKRARPPVDASSEGPTTDPAVTLLGERKQARAGAAAVGKLYDELAIAVRAGVGSTDAAIIDTIESADDNPGLAGFCDLMTEEARRQTVVYADRSAGLAGVEWTCERAMGLLLRRSNQHGGLERSVAATVVGVNAKGDRATATIRFGGPKGRLSTLGLVKEAGEWKLAATPAAPAP